MQKGRTGDFPLNCAASLQVKSGGIGLKQAPPYLQRPPGRSGAAGHEREQLKLAGSQAAGNILLRISQQDTQELKVSSPHTTLHGTKPMQDFIMKSAQLKAGKKHLLSVTVPACIRQEPPCKTSRTNRNLNSETPFLQKAAVLKPFKMTIDFTELHTSHRNPDKGKPSRPEF